MKQMLFRLKKEALMTLHQKKMSYLFFLEGSTRCRSTNKRSSETTKDQKIEENLLDIRSLAKEISSSMNVKNQDTSEVIFLSCK